jgi:glutaredoxin
MNYNKLFKIIIFSLFIVLLFITGSSAQNNSQNTPSPEDNKIYIFGLKTCPFCQQARKDIGELAAENDLEFSYLDLQEKNNSEVYLDIKNRLNIQSNSVPLITINDQYWIGYQKDTFAKLHLYLISNNIIKIEDLLSKEKTTEEQNRNQSAAEKSVPSKEQLINKIAADNEEKNIISSFLDTQNLENNNLLLSTILIGAIDGFNPCSLWMLTLLLGFLIHSNSKSKMLLVGISFLLTTAIIYGLFIIGIFKSVNLISNLRYLNIMTSIFILIFGIVNLKEYFYFKKGITTTISDKNKDKLIKKMRKIVTVDKGKTAIVLMTIIVASTAAIAELPCTSGFPVIWSKILNLNGINTFNFQYQILIITYLLFYLFDEILVFGVVLKTLKIKKIKINTAKKMKLFLGLMMSFIGVDLLFALGLVTSFSGLIIITVLTTVVYYLITFLTEYKNKRA